MIIQTKNPKLYKAWCDYLCKQRGVEFTTPQIRTEAFFKSENAVPVPLS